MMHATCWKDDDILDAVKEGYFTPEANGRKAA
jgi:hypothetical protein